MTEGTYSSSTSEGSSDSGATDATTTTTSTLTDSTVTTDATDATDSTVTTDATDSTVTTDATDSTDSTVTTDATDATSSTGGTDSSTDPTESESDTMVIEECISIDPVIELAVLNSGNSEPIEKMCGTDEFLYGRVNWDFDTLQFEECTNNWECGETPVIEVVVNHPVIQPQFVLDTVTLPDNGLVKVYLHYGEPVGSNICVVNGLGIANMSKMEFMMFKGRGTNPVPDMLDGEFMYNDMPEGSCSCQNDCCDLQMLEVGNHTITLEGGALMNPLVLPSGAAPIPANWHGDNQTYAVNVHSFFPDDCDAKPDFTWMISRLPLN